MNPGVELILDVNASTKELVCTLRNVSGKTLTIRRFFLMLDLRITGPEGAQPFPLSFGWVRVASVVLEPGAESTVRGSLRHAYGFPSPGEYTVRGEYHSLRTAGISGGPVDDVSASSNAVSITFTAEELSHPPRD